MYKEQEKVPEPEETIDKERGSDNNDEGHKKGKSSTEAIISKIERDNTTENDGPFATVESQ